MTKTEDEDAVRDLVRKIMGTIISELHVPLDKRIIAIEKMLSVDHVWLRKVDAGTDNECWIVCAKGDPGAALFMRVNT